MPLASTRVIHANWAAHHRPVAQGAMTAECTISSLGTLSGWDPVTGPTPALPPVVLYTGPCRVQSRVARAGEADAAGQPVTRRPYLVAIPAVSADIPVTARVHMDACTGDTHLVGKTLTVGDVVYAAERFERDLTCTLDLTNQEA